MSFTSNPWESSEGSSKYALTVNDQQTIQQVIDGIPVMAGSLASGITNPYIVNVPPGHEKEYYSLVRDASDAASDKRNVKVVFENNPNSEFKITQWDACNALTNWTGTTLTLDDTHNFEGSYCLKVIGDGASAYATNIRTGFTDIREYQEIALDVDFNSTEVDDVILTVYDSTGSYNQCRVSYIDMGHVRTTISFPLFFSNTSNPFDYSQLKTTRVSFTRRDGYTGDITAYFDNIRFVRTTPHRTAILRFDDSTDEHWSIAEKLLSEKGWKGSFLVTQPFNWGASSTLSLDQIKTMDRNGHDIINHTINSASFADLDFAETQYTYRNMQSALEHFGITKTAMLFGNPGHTSNKHLPELLKEAGCVSLTSKYNFYPTFMVGVNGPAFDIPTELQRFTDRGIGGIVQLMFHTITDEANLSTRLDWIEENFSEIILASEVVNRFPIEYKPIPRQQKRSGYRCTLSEGFRLYFYHGQELLIDPGGAARDIIPCGSNEHSQIMEFRPFHQVHIINTADAAETLTFDPLFTSSGTSDNTSDLLTFSTGAWITGQLVGRTVNNTTDSSSGVIIANTNTTVTAILSGGTNDTWTALDSFTITPVGSDQDITQGNSATFVYDGEGWH